MKYSLSELNEIIENRRTIFPEQFSERKVQREQVEKLINAAKWAPTHRLTQPWRFTIFMGQGLTDFGKFHADLYKDSKTAEDFSQMKYDKIFSRASVASAIIVVGVKRDPNAKVPFVEEIAATSAAVQNIALMATASGLALYWGTGGMTFSDEMKSHVGLNEDDQIIGQLFLGYPAGEWPRKTPRKPMEYFTDWRID
ncbi:MAG: nitroreductase [Salibacteraceae bacterium]|nr:nitroreductase [Salibacteraceae bacterium]|tara:strand:+ start:13084 stop:13674 length:591 start_codon:yes stop_codon:yes gene_type:complete